MLCLLQGDTSDEDEAYRTMMLIGPTGVGKTCVSTDQPTFGLIEPVCRRSMVHACASELGFNVIEVNASQDRSGIKVISELHIICN